MTHFLLILLFWAVQRPKVVKIEVCVCMKRKNNLIHASASLFGPEKLVLIWARGNLEQHNRDGDVMLVEENGKIFVSETWKQKRTNTLTRKTQTKQNETACSEEKMQKKTERKGKSSRL